MKKFISGLKLYVLNNVISYIPFSGLRNKLISLSIKSSEERRNFLIGVEYKAPRSITVGEGTVVNKGVLLDGRGGLIIGANVDIARGVTLWTMSHDYSEEHAAFSQNVVIGDNCWIGANSQILPGITIGQNVIIGCGSIVTKSFPDNVVIAGNPAKIIKERCVKSIKEYELNYKPWFI
ncbi:MAG: acetyltransferase-like isoleucine patch superfamily enzyme [Colwellia sp.]|jgi:acetyltransferase-like isoleucine patch superfamily enzyme